MILRKIAPLVMTFVLCGVSVSRADGIRIDVRSVRTHSLLTFAQSLAGAPGVSPSLLALFEQSDYANDAPVLAAVRELEAIDVYDYYEFGGFPRGRHNDVQVWQLLNKASGEASNLESFRSLTFGLLPNEDHVAMMNALTTLDPVFEELVWTPYENRLNKVRDELVARMDEVGFQGKFDRAARFYRTAWDEHTPFVVGLYPVPRVDGRSLVTATPDANILTVGIRTEGGDLDGTLAVIFHELCHLLYRGQSRGVQQDIEDAFLTSPSDFRLKAYEIFDEAVATALGQGWFFETVSGEMDDGSWYAVEQIDRMAKTIYPDVRQRMEADDGAMDDTFIQALIARYESAFPDALNRVELFMPDVMLLFNRDVWDENTLFPVFFENFSMRSIDELSPPWSVDRFDELETGFATAVVVLSRGDKRSTGYLAERWPRIAEAVEASGTSDVLVTALEGGRARVVVIAGTIEGVGAALATLAGGGRIPTEMTVWKVGGE